MFTFLSHFAVGTVDGILLLPFAIVLCAILFEDLTAIVVGVLAADGIVSVQVAFLSFYIGIVIGDAMLYSLGSLARTHPRLAHYIDHDFTASFRSWLESRYSLIIFFGHFVPGLRFTTYVASGFFRYPLSVFIPRAIASGLLLGTVLLSVSYWFGNVTSEWVSHIRWGIAGVFLLVLFFVGRHNLLAHMAKKNGPESA